MSGCATLPSDFREPEARLQSITPRAGGGVLPVFEIRIMVSNPNRSALEVDGVSYRLALQGHDIFQGVANDVPSIPAYGEAEVVLDASADLLGGIGLLTELLNAPAEPINYAFEARIDIGSFYPTVTLRREGQLTLP